MPTLEELRRQFRLGPSTLRKTEPDEAYATELEDDDEKAAVRGRSRARWTSHPRPAGGTRDATLHFGKHRGKKLSEIALIERDYITNFILKDDGFPDDLREVAREVLAGPGLARTGGVRHISADLAGEILRVAPRFASAVVESRSTKGLPPGFAIIDDPTVGDAD